MPRPVPPRRLVLVSAALCGLLAVACSRREPEPIALHEDQCGYCRMTISDARFGGEAVRPTGRVMKFDAAECMLAWARATPAEERGDLYIIDLQHPGTFVPVTVAGFLVDGTVRGPMGGSVLGFASARQADAQRATLGGRLTTWAELLADTAAVGRH